MVGTPRWVDFRSVNQQADEDLPSPMPDEDQEWVHYNWVQEVWDDEEGYDVEGDH